MTPPDDPALVRVLASDGTFAPTPEAERYLPLIDALTDSDLETFYRDRWYNVFAVYDRDDGVLKGWYCNVTRPATITDAAVSSDDLALDVWVSPAGDVTVLDEDEFAALPLPPADRTAARAALAQLLALAGRGELPA